MTEQTDADLIREVQDRFRAAEEFESQARARFKDDLRFMHGDSYNNWQWASDVYRARNPLGQAGRPTLTVNKCAQHILQITNDARQNQQGVKVNATGFGATEKAAEAIEGIIRHIETQSNAQQNAYARAIQGQVEGGIGWVHITTDYVRGADTFDQDLFIESVPDALSVYSDPDTREPDHSDMQWAMIVTHMPRGEFERDYPEDKDLTGPPLAELNEDTARDWDGRDVVRVARYYRLSEKKDTLWNIPQGLMATGTSAIEAGFGKPIQSIQTALDGSGSSVVSAKDGSGVQPIGSRQANGQLAKWSTPLSGGPTRESQMPEALVEMCRSLKCQSRELFEPYVEWFLIGGNRVIDSGDTVFKHVPLVPFIGIETVIDDKLDRKGLVRSLIDPQRMFNYAASAFVESIAVQTKSPWLTDVRAIEGYENEWASANTTVRAYLPYNSADPDSGAEIAPPTRVDPPTFSQGHLQAMQQSDLQMQMVTGQYQAELGAPGNERSGRAINERQRQSDTANYHFTDNQGMALRLIGRILIDALPNVYDVHRAVQILGLDGSQTQAVLDPTLQQAHAVATPQGPAPSTMDPDDAMEMQGAILAINPKVGRYDVEADVGPSYATRRQEAFDALMQIMPALGPELPKVADLFFRTADFPLADEIADRLKPPSQDPALMQAQQQIQALTAHNAQLEQQLKSKQVDQQIKLQDQQHGKVADVMREETDRYKAETDRMAAVGSIDPAMLIGVLRQVVSEAMGKPVPVAANDDPSLGGPDPAVPPLPTTNAPGGPVRSPMPSNGAVQ